jgi:hypothetical protein
MCDFLVLAVNIVFFYPTPENYIIELHELRNCFRYMKYAMHRSILMATSPSAILPRMLEPLLVSPSEKFCAFCKHNKERKSFWLGHYLKDDVGNVTCPILSKYKCPICGATGTNAHTVKHCPQYRGSHGIRYGTSYFWRNVVGSKVTYSK